MLLGYFNKNPDIGAILYLLRKNDHLLRSAGFYDAFSPHYNNWVAQDYLAIDQGPEIIEHNFFGTYSCKMKTSKMD